MNTIIIDNILLVEVPENAECFIIANILHIKGIGKYRTLSPGNWQFIGTTDAITEEIAMKIVEKIRTIAFMKPFKNYLFPDGPDYYWNVLLSYQSWLRAGKVPTDKRFTILKQEV